MSENTTIEWCNHTWNPWRGCTKVSPGCAHCYAERQSKRNPAVLGQWGNGAPRVLAKNWGDPMKWNKSAEGKLLCTGCGRVGPAKTWREDILKESKTAVACCPDNAPRPYRPAVFPSFCDWLDDEVPIEWLVRFLQLIHDTPNLDWLLLTKRPENFRSRLEAAMEPSGWIGRSKFVADWVNGTPPKNVWVGTSVEDQQRCDERIPELLKIPAKLRFLSVEPLLEPVDLQMALESFHTTAPDLTRNPSPIDWIICGGESGPKSRPCHVNWIRSIVRQCAATAVPCFVKQLGSRPLHEVRFNKMGDTCTERVFIKHPKGGDPYEWPKDMRVRQFPEVMP